MTSSVDSINIIINGSSNWIGSIYFQIILDCTITVCAVDKVSKSTPRVTNFTVDAAQYNENASKLDRDKDGIACEKP